MGLFGGQGFSQLWASLLVTSGFCWEFLRYSALVSPGGLYTSQVGSLHGIFPLDSLVVY